MDFIPHGREIVSAFLRLGATSYGGPAIMGVMQAELQERRQWLSKPRFLEGLAMGAFAHGYRHNRDPLARKLFQLVMTDEAFHHKFGKIWADRTVPQLSQAERDLVEDWTAHCAQKLLFDRGDPRQMAEIYGRFGLDPIPSAGRLHPLT